MHAVDDVSYDLVAGGDARDRRRVGLGQVGELDGDPRTAAEDRDRHRRGRSSTATNLIGRSEKQLQAVRGDKIAMIFQDALASLNPVHRVGDQIGEAITVHHAPSKDELRDRVRRAARLVGIPNPSERVDQYPHEYSGGMRQRAMIAMAIANDPDLLIADEPTTALDVTIQAQVLDVLERIQDRTNSAILLITHDLGVVAGIADRVLVMYAGRQVEIGDVDQTFYDPRHPYTRGSARLAAASRRQLGEPAAGAYRGSAAVVDRAAVGLRVPSRAAGTRISTVCA